MRTEKITRLREQLRQGTYHIRAAEVAKAILRSEPSYAVLTPESAPLRKRRRLHHHDAADGEQLIESEQHAAERRRTFPALRRIQVRLAS